MSMQFQQFKDEQIELHALVMATLLSKPIAVGTLALWALGYTIVMSVHGDVGSKRL